MRNIFVILLFFCNCAYSQVTITKVSPGAGSHQCLGTGVVNIQHANIPLTQDKLYLAVVFSDSSTNYGLNISGTSFTWDTVLQIQSHTRRIAVYRCMPTSSTTTDDPKAEFSFGSYPNNIDFHIYEITGVLTGNNGANAIGQAAIDSATGANPTISTMGALYGGSSVFALFTNNRNTFTGTAESGFTESVDDGCSTFAGATYINGVYIEYKTSSGDNTPSVTSASSDWIGAAIELKAANRRIIITN